MNAIDAIDADARRVRVEPGVVQEDLNRAAQALRARLRAGHVDVEPGDARRHDRQQLLGQRVDRLRHDDRSRRSSSRSCSPTARAPRSRADSRRAARSSGGSTAASRRSCATTRGRSPRTTRSTGASPAATGSTAWTRSTCPSSIVGSEGTLAIVTAATVGLVELPKAKMFAVGHFDSLLGAIAATDDALELQPCAVEMIDRTILGALARQARVPAPRRPARGRPGRAAVRLLLGRHRRPRCATSSTSSSARGSATATATTRCAPRPRPSRTR